VIDPTQSQKRAFDFGRTVVISCVMTILFCSCAHGSESDDKHFTLRVLPVLRTKCLGCHGNDAEDLKGDFDMRSRDVLLKGGESEEAAIIPGDPEASPLYQAVRWDGLEMPPKENDRLTQKQIEDVHAWIKAGAPWPDEEKQKRHRESQWADPANEDGVLVRTSGGLSDDWTYRRYQPEDVWAFQPLADTASDVPAGKHPIDHYHQTKLKYAGFAPAPQADARTLIRRATYDLIGLPPSAEEIQAFEAATKEDADAAWTELIDRLLASPHYGERWGQHWLDIARYADTGGYSNDYERSNAWRYRDYVVRSFNEDKPYDQFVVEQLAGDELADESVRQKNGGDEAKVQQARLQGNYTEQEAEWLVATGFLRMGPWDNAMTKEPQARQIFIDDVVNSVGQTFLSTTMRCFKCHDHKFDPLPTRDYYRMYAAFQGTQMAERNVPFCDDESTQNFETGQAHVQKLRDFAIQEKNRIKAKQEKADRTWFKENSKPFVAEKDRKKLADEDKPPRHHGLDYMDEGQLKVREQDEWIWNRRMERYQPMAQSVYNAAKPKIAGNAARKLRIDTEADLDVKPVSYILMGGAVEAPGDKVRPGVISGIGLSANSNPDDGSLLTDDVNGRRTQLAKWIASPDNPLTTRSIVNRIWQHHFVFPIARNPNNFGAKGGKPTHPHLLDWLARDFVENGWRIKRLHRLIMTSAAYRQAARHPKLEALQTDDPTNELLAYFAVRRLTAEELRDTMLTVTGELKSELGGLPVMPEINMEVALQPRMIQFSIAPAYQPSPTPSERNRRTIYAYRVRGQADPFLELFNQPNPNDSCEERDVAAVTPQVFTLLNSDMITDRSIALAKRIEQDTKEPDEQVVAAFLSTFGRKTSDKERRQMVDYLTEMVEYHQDKVIKPTEYPTKITRSLVEEFSGKPFEYEEILPVFENYVADTKADEVSSTTRALADLCLLLFNSNEFIYVY